MATLSDDASQRSAKAEEVFGESIMTVMADAQTAAAPYDNETPTANVTYTFKTTEENKEKMMNVSLNQDVSEFLTEISVRSARWRSAGQFLNDALVYYLNNDGETTSVETIIEGADWSSEYRAGAAITETLWEEIDLLVNHSHTEWNTKQEFYICALFCYIQDDFPIVERR